MTLSPADRKRKEERMKTATHEKEQAIEPDDGADSGEGWCRGNVGMRCTVRSELGVICDTGSLRHPYAEGSIGRAERIIRAHYAAQNAVRLTAALNAVVHSGAGAGNV